MFRSTPNSVVGSLNSSSSIETTYSLGSASTNSLQNSCFLSLDIEDFCESYSRLKLAERDPAQDVNSPTTSSISNTMMRNTTIISSSLNNNNTTTTQPTIIQELNLFETRHQQQDLNNNNQQNNDDEEEEPIQSSSFLSNQQVSSNYESFSKFLAFLTKQDEEQNSVFVSPRSGGGVLVGGESSTMNRIISPRNIHASKFSYISNNVADSLSIENIGMNIGESAASSPSTPTSSTTSNSILSNSNTNPKDSKNKLASSPKRKTSTASNISNTSSTTTTSSSGIPSLINTKLTKQNKTTRKRKNSSTSPSQLSMQFNFPMWTFHFSKGRSNK